MPPAPPKPPPIQPRATNVGSVGTGLPPLVGQGHSTAIDSLIFTPEAIYCVVNGRREQILVGEPAYRKFYVLGIDAAERFLAHAPAAAKPPGFFGRLIGRGRREPTLAGPLVNGMQAAPPLPGDGRVPNLARVYVQDDMIVAHWAGGQAFRVPAAETPHFIHSLQECYMELRTSGLQNIAGVDGKRPKKFTNASLTAHLRIAPESEKELAAAHAGNAKVPQKFPKPVAVRTPEPPLPAAAPTSAPPPAATRQATPVADALARENAAESVVPELPDGINALLNVVSPEEAAHLAEMDQTMSSGQQATETPPAIVEPEKQAAHESSAKRPQEITPDPGVVFRKDAVLASDFGYERILHGWSQVERRAIAVECDESGDPLHDRLPYELTAVPTGPIRIVKSAHPAIPDGTDARDPALIPVTHGTFKGHLIGELTAEEIEVVRNETRVLRDLPLGVKISPSSLPRRVAIDAPARTLTAGTAPAEDEARKLLNRDARLERMKLMTAAMNQIPPTRVLEEMYGFAGDEAGTHVKYRIDGDVLLNVEKNGARWGALNGHKFTCLGGKGGSGGAINLVKAVEEARGGLVEFDQVKQKLGAHFADILPPLDDAGIKAPRLAIKIGQVDPAVWYHKGAVLQPVNADGSAVGAAQLVIDGWTPGTKRFTAVDVDESGQRMVRDGKAAEPRTFPLDKPVPEAVDLGLGADRAILVRSSHHQLRPGSQSNDPGLVLAPFGPCQGMMLGQLSDPQLQNLATIANSPRFRQTVMFTVPRRFAPGVNAPEKKVEDLGQEVEQELPRRASRITVPLHRSSVPANSPYIVARLGANVVLDNEKIARDYLIQQRKLPADLVDAALKEGLAFPTESVVFKKDEVTGEKTSEVVFHNPSVCLPIRGLATGKIIAHQLKTVHLDPNVARRQKGKDSHNFGPVQQGFAMLGDFDPATTKEVVVTEAWIDGMSYRALKNPPPTTCVMATTGTRTPDALIALCQKQGIALTRALDNDHPGRTMSGKIGEECAAAGVATRDEIVGPSEIQLILEDDEAGQKRLAEMAAFCAAGKIMHVQLPAPKGQIHLAIDNTAESAERAAQLKESDRRECLADGRPRRRLSIEIANKDWNDQIKGGYVRSFSSQFEAEFKAGGDPEPVGAKPASLDPTVSREETTQEVSLGG